MNRRFWLFYEFNRPNYSYDIMEWVYASAKGYFGGGYASSRSNEIDGIQFSDEAAINPAATLAVARYALAGVQAGNY